MERFKHNPAILFLHDGELAELSAALEAMDVDCIERRADLIDADRVRAWDVVLASSKRMLALRGEFRETPSARIAVLDGDSKTVRSMLRRAGTDLVVRRPVHPAALRLLILHSVYHGSEKRRSNRVSVGASVRISNGLRRRNAILAELSPTGCGLLEPIGSRQSRPGTRLKIQLPAELCEGHALSLHGSVTRVEPGDSGTVAIAINFGKLRAGTLRRLRRVIANHSEGPAVLDTEAAQELGALPMTLPTDATESPPDPPLDNTAERRNDPRHVASRRIVALGKQAERVLIGSDLSAGGMRVEPAPGLEIGDRLKISLHVQSSALPLVLSAEVVRGDAQSGHALRFVDIDEPQRKRLRKVLDDLPLVSELEPDHGQGLYVSEILARHAG